MSGLMRLARLLQDAAPAHIFEVSEAGIAHARSDSSGQVDFRALRPEIVSPSPLRDNILQPEAFAAEVRAFVPPGGSKKRMRAALILPDFAGRVAVLDFDSFPTDPMEQASLVRFRMKKSVPFDVESAVVSYHPQPVVGKKRFEVVVALSALEIVARYEAPFRAAGFHPGMVTVSTVTALNLLPPESSVLARLSGRVLTVTVTDGPLLKLVRCVELPEVNEAEISAMLYPTFAFIEDQLASRPTSLLLCGFGELADQYAQEWEAGLNVSISPLRSRFGPVGPNNAGLLGFLQGQVQ